jgi:hypothetical protein
MHDDGGRKWNFRDSDEYIVPFGGPRSGRTRRQYQVQLQERDIYRHLVNSEQRPGRDGVCEFVNAWGLLTHTSLIAPLETFLRQRQAVVRALKLLSQKKSVVRELGHSNNDVATLLKEVVWSGSISYPNPNNPSEESTLFLPRPGLSLLGALHANGNSSFRRIRCCSSALLSYFTPTKPTSTSQRVLPVDVCCPLTRRAGGKSTVTANARWPTTALCTAMQSTKPYGRGEPSDATQVAARTDSSAVVG